VDTIYIRLMNAGEDAWRPVHAQRRPGDLYQIMSRNDDPESEVWQFHAGSLVRCEPRLIAGIPQLVAVELLRPQELSSVK
jgi:hypothetical protein